MHLRDAARRARFVAEFAVDLNATQAAIRAGYGVSGAKVTGHKLLRRPEIAAAIKQAQAAQMERTAITADAVLQRLWTIATADPRELIEYRHTCCRYCHGADFGYQRTPAEMARERAKWEAAQTKKSKEGFDEAGGVGYNGTLPPHPQCPECFGEGVERVFVHDTRHLSPSARALYAGVKTTKDGLEVKMHDQTAALVDVGKHLGMFKEKPETPLSEDERIARLRKAFADMDALTTGAA